MRGLSLLRLRGVVGEAARALDAIEQGDDVGRQRGGRALRAAFVRVELMMVELQAGDLSGDEARELAVLGVELVRVAVRAQGEEWKAAALRATRGK